jgi:hypothetical protein
MGPLSRDVARCDARGIAGRGRRRAEAALPRGVDGGVRCAPVPAGKRFRRPADQRIKLGPQLGLGYRRNKSDGTWVVRVPDGKRGNWLRAIVVWLDSVDISADHQITADLHRARLKRGDHFCIAARLSSALCHDSSFIVSCSAPLRYRRRNNLPSLFHAWRHLL